MYTPSQLPLQRVSKNPLQIPFSQCLLHMPFQCPSHSLNQCIWTSGLCPFAHCLSVPLGIPPRCPLRMPFRCPRAHSLSVPLAGAPSLPLAVAHQPSVSLAHSLSCSAPCSCSSPFGAPLGPLSVPLAACGAALLTGRLALRRVGGCLHAVVS